MIEVVFIAARLDCGAFAAVENVQPDGNRPPRARCCDGDHGMRPYVPVGIDTGVGECPACHGLPAGHHDHE